MHTIFSKMLVGLRRTLLGSTQYWLALQLIVECLGRRKDNPGGVADNHCTYKGGLVRGRPMTQRTVDWPASIWLGLVYYFQCDNCFFFENWALSNDKLQSSICQGTSPIEQIVFLIEPFLAIWGPLSTQLINLCVGFSAIFFYLNPCLSIYKLSRYS